MHRQERGWRKKENNRNSARYVILPHPVKKSDYCAYLSKASHKREVEKLLKSVQEENKQKVADLVKELEEVSVQQAKQLENIQHLRADAKSSREKRERELTENHKREMGEVEESWRREVERCCAETALVKTEAERVVEELRKRHRTELDALRQVLEEERGAAESRRWEERERTLRDELKAREEDLAGRASGLSQELRTVKDHLMVARQQVAEVTEKMETSRGEVCGLQSQLKAAQTERERLREQLELLQMKSKSAEREGEELKRIISEKDG